MWKEKYEEAEQRAQTWEQKYTELQAKLQWYEEQFRLQKQRQYGRSSEKSSKEQLELPLFNEAEITEPPMGQEPTVETITYQRKKKKGSRKEKLANLPVETVEYRLEESEQVCSCCNGKLHVMSTQVRQELQVIPAQVKLVKHVQHVYACRHCERNEIETPIVTAPKPKPVLAGSLASPSAVAHIVQQKYVEGVPLYRQEKQWERLGVSLSRQTMANWIIQTARIWLHPLYEQLKQHLCQQDILHVDETTLQVLAEPGRDAASKSYMWLYRTGKESQPIVLYEYQPTRQGAHPKQFLRDFAGYVHVDGYSGYNKLDPAAITLVGCLAHARRKFKDAQKALPKQNQAEKKGIAYEGEAFIRQLYHIEKEATKEQLTPEERHAWRQKKSKPILDAFLAWLQEKATIVLPKSATGDAISYCLNKWQALQSYLQDGRLEIDNNRAERSIKPFVIGRKNWLFAQSTRGATASATVYSIIETAKENKLNPFAYLTYLLEQLPQRDLQHPAAFDDLLPWSPALPEHCRIPSNP
jgi:transposase